MKRPPIPHHQKDAFTIWWNYTKPDEEYMALIGAGATFWIHDGKVVNQSDVHAVEPETCPWCDSPSPTVVNNIRRILGMFCHDCGATFLVEA